MFFALHHRIGCMAEMVLRIEPCGLLGQKSVELNTHQSQAQIAIRNVLAKKQLQLTAVQNRLEALNPRSVLSRGYSITTNEKTGQIVRTAEDVEAGDDIVTELAGSELIQSRVIKTAKSKVER